MLEWQCQEQVQMGPGCLTSAGENLSAWVRRSCLNLRKEKAGAGRESGEGPGRHTEDQRTCLTALPSCFPVVPTLGDKGSSLTHPCSPPPGRWGQTFGKRPGWLPQGLSLWVEAAR